MLLQHLLSIRQEFNDKQILLCFNGPISRSLIEEIGTALRNYLTEDQVGPSVSTDVFGIYIELTQNIRHYSQGRGYSDMEGSATVVVARHGESKYSVLAGNVIERTDGVALMEQVQALAAMDKASLKAAYKKQLRAPRDHKEASGAGLGLLDVARKSTEPLRCHLVDTPDGKAFFSLLAVV